MYIFIVNPVAGNGRGYKIFKKLSKSMIYQQIIAEYYLTEYPGHAEEITKNISKGSHVELKAIIVIGGDGTIHEVMNGLKNTNTAVSFIPGGSGNDFGRGSGITGSPISILKKIVEDTSGIPYWNGDYNISGSSKRSFINSIGFGFDAEIAAKANLSTYKKFFNVLHLGKLSYVIALIQVLFKFKPIQVELHLDGHTESMTDCWMVTVANHPYYGGGMKIIPSAKIEADLLPVLVIQGISKWKILGLFLTVFTGRHIQFKEVTLYKAKKLTITAKSNITYQVDGQTDTCQSCVITKNIQPIQIMGSDFSLKLSQTS
ncbi:diacylglycerol/lipid kinase family protein [Ornithinibacillus xuwenensis]|uniref:Diacylglycerol kinase family protein n=1 Tax=Ornithinibacillus xuwenensis TaxID=3144668 RepID=A0ABU9XLP9_9BACI